MTKSEACHCLPALCSSLLWDMQFSSGHSRVRLCSGPLSASQPKIGTKSVTFHGISAKYVTRVSLNWEIFLLIWEVAEQTGRGPQSLQPRRLSAPRSPSLSTTMRKLWAPSPLFIQIFFNHLYSLKVSEVHCRGGTAPVEFL